MMAVPWPRQQALCSQTLLRLSQQQMRSQSSATAGRITSRE